MSTPLQLPPGMRILGTITPPFAEILTPDALAFIAKLHHQFEPRGEELLAKRRGRQMEFDAGEMPNLVKMIGFSMMLLAQLAAQQSSIQGKVLDENDEPLTGVNIYLEGTVLGAASDQNGSYRITQVPAGTFILVFNMIGYQQEKQEIQITAGTTIEAGLTRLKVAPISGESIVITASKYEQRIQDVPVSLSVLNRQEIRRVTLSPLIRPCSIFRVLISIPPRSISGDPAGTAWE